MRALSSLAILVFLAPLACASSPSPYERLAQARNDSLGCAADLLAGLGYDVHRSDDGAWVEANRLAGAPQVWVSRDVVQVGRAAAEPMRLRVRASTWIYQPASHGRPVDRQTAHGTTASAETIAAADAVAARCGGAVLRG